MQEENRDMTFSNMGCYLDIFIEHELLEFAKSKRNKHILTSVISNIIIS